MTDQIEPRNRAERRAVARRTRKVAALGSGAVLAFSAAGTATTLFASTPAGAAAPIEVTSLADDGGGSATTLREAIDAANAAAGQDTITFQTGLTGTITLASDLPHITDALDIQGPGASVVTVDGAKHAIFNFYATGSGSNGVSGLTITGGEANNNDGSGGGITSIDNSADITIADAVITGNHAENDGGGVQSIDSSGTMTVRNTTISGNTADSAGGGLYADSDNDLNLVVESSTFSGNHADGGDGGGLYLSDLASATISGTSITGNTAHSNGGGIYAHDVVLSISNSTISGNSSGDGGGGLYLDNAPTTIEFTTISGNTSARGGGGIQTGYYVPEGKAAVTGDDVTLTIRNSTISGNSAQYYGGGLYITLSGQTTIENSTISGNHARQAGGIYGGYAGVTLTQVTVTNNAATDPDNGVPAGGIQFAGVRAIKSANAGHDNSDAKAPTDHGGQHPTGRASVSAAAVGTLDSVGTIIAGNVGEDVGVESGDVTVQSDHSVLGNVDGAVTVDDLGGTQLHVADPGLGPLADNGGPTPTQALLAGSVAINAGPVPVPTFTGNEFDQRGSGFARVVDGVVDVGAYEVQPGEIPSAVVVTPRFTG